MRARLVPALLVALALAGAAAGQDGTALRGPADPGASDRAAQGPAEPAPPDPLPPRIFTPAPPAVAPRLSAPAADPGGGGQCRTGCAQAYYFCLAQDEADVCGPVFGQCVLACPRASGAPG